MSLPEGQHLASIPEDTTPSTVSPVASEKSTWRLCIALAILSTMDFLWTVRFPLQVASLPHDIDLGYLPLYLGAYFFDTWFDSPMHSAPSYRTLAGAAVLSATSILVLGVAIAAVPDDQTTRAILIAAYAVCSNVTGYLVTSVVLFSLDQYTSRPIESVARLTYPAFLVHGPVSTALEVVFDGWGSDYLANAAVMGTVSTFVSWALAWALEAGLDLFRVAVHDIYIKHEERKSRTCQVWRKSGQQKAGYGSEILEGLGDVGI